MGDFVLEAGGSKAIVRRRDASRRVAEGLKSGKGRSATPRECKVGDIFTKFLSNFTFMCILHVFGLQSTGLVMHCSCNTQPPKVRNPQSKIGRLIPISPCLRRL